MSAIPSTAIYALHLDATDGEALQRIQHLLTARLEGFGRRDALRVDWQGPTDPPSTQDGTAPTVVGPAPVGSGRWRTPTAGAVLAVALVIAVHSCWPCSRVLRLIRTSPGWPHS